VCIATCPQLNNQKNNMKISDIVVEAKKDSVELDRKTARDPRTAVALRRAYSKYPTAGSDIEAYIRQEIEKSSEIDQDLSRQQQTNARQDSYLSRLQDLAKKQNAQLKSLDDENDTQEREIQDLEQQLNNIGTTPAPIAQPSADKKSEPKSRNSLGPAFDPMPQQAQREKIRQASSAQINPTAPAKVAEPASTIDLMPKIADPGDSRKNTFAPMVKALTSPNDAFSRMARELEPKQKELPFDNNRPGQFDTSKAVDVPYRELTSQIARKLATLPPAQRDVLYDPAAVKSVANQRELDLTERLKALAGIP
jgi:hypothetical protein